MGYSISLAISVNRLMNDNIQTVRVMYFKMGKLILFCCKHTISKKFIIAFTSFTLEVCTHRGLLKS